MNIWIFNHHALIPDMGGGTRHFDFAKELVRRGHHVTIVASSFHYAKFEEIKTYPDTPYLHEKIDGVSFIWIKTRPYQGNGFGRVLNMIDYTIKALRIKIQAKPDVIIGSTVHLFAVFAAYRQAKQLKVPFVMEIRDIWPQTLIDMGISRWHPFIILLGWLERFLYRRADKIITLLPYAYEHIKRFGIKEDDVIWISNGVDVARSQQIKPYEFGQNKIHITYAGTIGQANQIQTFIAAASALQTNTHLLFHIIGNGPLKKVLEAIKPSNVLFHGSVAKEQAIAMIKGSDILFFPLADAPVFKFGISSNKLFDYLASKRPIIFASNSKNNPIKEANAGISIKAADAEMLIDAIKQLSALSYEARMQYGENGFDYVNKRFSIFQLAAKLEETLALIVYNPTKKSYL